MRIQEKSRVNLMFWNKKVHVVKNDVVIDDIIPMLLKYLNEEQKDVIAREIFKIALSKKDKDLDAVLYLTQFMSKFLNVPVPLDEAEKID
jgi:hypothetical protein